MGTKFIRLCASLTTAIMVPSILRAGNPPVSKVHLTIRMYDYVSLPAADRAELEATAVRVFRLAGIDASFLDCYTDPANSGARGCAAFLGVTDFMLRVLDPSLTTTRKERGHAIVCPAGGVALTVFARPGEQSARVPGVSEGTLLGHIVAHEIGHLLLGVNSHSVSGIMRAVWRLCDEEWMAQGLLVFQAEEATRMRAALAGRSLR